MQASKGGLALAECLTSNKIVKNLDVESNDLPLPACHKLAGTSKTCAELKLKFPLARPCGI